MLGKNLVLKSKCRRLRVPKYGAILEFLNFAALLILFVLCVSSECFEL